jgi:hypothetical protein
MRFERDRHDSGLNAFQVKDKDARLPFNRDEISKIFSSPLFTSSEL